MADEKYILVPVKPSIEMVKAGEKWSALPEQTWQDMIDASPIHNEAERLAEENERLRHIISDCAAALVTGAFISPKATVEFMEGLPKEISLVVSELRSALHSTQEG